MNSPSRIVGDHVLRCVEDILVRCTLFRRVGQFSTVCFNLWGDQRARRNRPPAQKGFSSWTEYNEALSLAVRDKRADREKIARERIAHLTPLLGKLVVRAEKSFSSLPGARLELDGAPLLAASYGVALPMDKGGHKLVAFADGHRVAKLTIETVDGQVKEVEAPMPGPPVAASVATPTPSSVKDKNASTPAGTPWLAYGVGVSGLLGLGVGTALGVHAMSIGDQSAVCTLGPDAAGCPAEAVDKQNRARSAGTVSTVAFIAGGALVGTAVALWIWGLRSAPPPVSAAVTPSGGVLAIQGVF